MSIRKIITRKEWGARAPRGKNTVVWRRPTVWVHQTENKGYISKNLSFNQEKQTMRDIQNFHMGPSRKWWDIGYSYIIFPSGRIYEGRGKNVQGSHCYGKNDQPSVAFYGYFESELPTSYAFESFRWLRRQLNAIDLKGHRDGIDTDCPGDALYNYFFRN